MDLTKEWTTNTDPRSKYVVLTATLIDGAGITIAATTGDIHLIGQYEIVNECK